jgi:hypothetical protein
MSNNQNSVISLKERRAKKLIDKAVELIKEGVAAGWLDDDEDDDGMYTTHYVFYAHGAFYVSSSVAPAQHDGPFATKEDAIAFAHEEQELISDQWPGPFRRNVEVEDYTDMEPANRDRWLTALGILK